MPPHLDNNDQTLLRAPRRDSKEVIQWIRDRLAIYTKNKQHRNAILERGGLEESLIKKDNRCWNRYLENLASNPELISNTHELQATGRIVTIGSKT